MKSLNIVQYTAAHQWPHHRLAPAAFMAQGCASCVHGTEGLIDGGCLLAYPKFTIVTSDMVCDAGSLCACLFPSRTLR